MGTADPDFRDPAAEAAWIVDHLADAEQLLIARAGHYPQAEEPEIVNPVLIAFAEKVLLASRFSSSAPAVDWLPAPPTTRSALGRGKSRHPEPHRASAVREAATGAPAERSCGPGPVGRMDRAGASRSLTRVARAAGISHSISPHGLHRTFCTTGLVAGLSIRDMQYAMCHADPRSTMGYDMGKANLDRHAAHAVAAYLAGMSIG